jgi:hypothetical protein
MTAVHVAEVRLYLFDGNAEYKDMGDVGCAIVATPPAVPRTPPVFRLGCYRGDEYMCTAEITASNDTGLQLALQGQGYVSFRDDQERLWSMHFASDEDAVTLAAHVTVAMYGASNLPDNRIVCCDVTQGKREKQIYAADRVKVRFQSWVLSRDGGVPQLGSRLEGNEHEEKPYAFTVPPNHNSVTNDMVGFEGMSVGMAEESRRFVVVPQAAKRGKGPAVHSVFMIYIVKKKDNFESDDKPANKAGAAKSQGARASHHRDADDGGFGEDADNHHAPHHALHGAPGGGGYGNYGPQPIVIQQHYPQPAPVAAIPAAAVAAPVHHYPALMAVEQPPEALPRPPPAGFSYEQMELLERLRDQVGAMMVAVRDTTTNVDMLHSDFKQHDQKTKPPTLIAAQMDHSLRTLIAETDELKAELAKRDETLNSLEERNKQLQQKADKFAKTASQLADERKATLAQSGETKVDLDQTMLSLQAKLTRVLADREDVGRHLATVKRLLEISDKDTRDAKQQLQVAEVQLTTNEARLASTEEGLQEERARRKLLEAKIVTLGDELRSIVDEFRTKDGQVDDRRRQMNAAKLHYGQLMDDERAQAASEMRDLRQELIDELAVRDRRYQDERVRVAKDSYERGRAQGVEDGEKAELLEGDMLMQTLSFESQRHRSELEMVRIQLRQVHEQAATDHRRLDAQISALTRVIDDVTSQNQVMETELHSLEAAKETVAAAALEDAKAVLMKLTRPIGKKDLFTLIHRLRVKQDPDLSFEVYRSEEESAVIAQEQREVASWVRRTLPLNTQFNPHEIAPPLRLLSPQEAPAPDAPVVITPDPAEPNSDPFGALARAMQAPSSVDMVEVERRQKELLAALHANNPALELAPPPRDPTPTPPRSPSPEPEQEPEPAPAAAPEQLAPQAAASSEHAADVSEGEDDHEAHAAPQAAVAAAAPSDGDKDEEQSGEQQQLQPPVSSPPTQQQQPASDDEDAAPAPAATAAKKAPAPAPKKGASAFSDEETEDSAPRFAPAPKPAAKQPAKAPPEKQSAMFGGDTEDENSEARFTQDHGPLGGGASAPSKAPVAKKAATGAAPKQPAPKPAPRHASLFDGSDEGEDAPQSPQPTSSKAPTAAPGAKAPTAKRAPPTASIFGAAGNSDDDSDEAPKPARPPAVLAVAKAKAPPAAAVGKKGGGMFASDSEEDDGPLVVPASKRPAAPAAKRPAAPPAKKAMASMFADSEED